MNNNCTGKLIIPTSEMDRALQMDGHTCTKSNKDTEPQLMGTLSRL